MNASEDSARAQFTVFAFLQARLCNGGGGFRAFGPHSLIFEDERDKLLVYVGLSNLVIVHDGPDVVHGIEMIQLLPGVAEDDEMDDYYLQPILHRF